MRSWKIVVIKINSRSQIWKQVDGILMKGNLETHLEHFHEFYRAVFVITQCIILICFSNIALISGFDQCRESRKFNILCHLVHLVISQLKMFFASPAVKGRVLWIRVCSSKRFLVSFFPKAQLGVKDPCCVFRDIARFSLKNLSGPKTGKQVRNGPTIGLSMIECW